MAVTPNAAQARIRAEGLLGPLGDRWAHVRAVADRARELSAVLEVHADRELLVASAWLHDVGYAPTVRHTGCHQLDGAAYLERQGLTDRICALVAHHSGASFEIAERGQSDLLNRWDREESALVDALWTADMTTGPRGEPLDFPGRLAEILQRYEPGSVVARAMRAAEPSIHGAIARTARRMERAQRI